jgi:Cu+-exporting ATPase
MKGFGINDAPPVATAEVGKVLYSDTDVAKVTGGIILIKMI